MTRVVGGSAGGRRLRTPPGSGTRPTSDRVREALFSALEARVGDWAGLRVLDLYAGSGAVGIEALSRGAGRAVMVEHDRRAAAVVRANLASVGLPGGEVWALPVARVLAAPAAAPFDVVFADPPYAEPSDVVDGVVAALVAHGWLVPGGTIVLERASRSPGPAPVTGLGWDRARRYGETVLWYGRADP